MNVLGSVSNVGFTREDEDYAKEQVYLIINNDKKFLERLDTIYANYGKTQDLRQATSDLLELVKDAVNVHNKSADGIEHKIDLPERRLMLLGQIMLINGFPKFKYV